MTLPYPNSPDKDENIGQSITRIEQNLEYLDGQLRTTTIKHVVKTYSMDTVGDAGGVQNVSGVGFTPTAVTVYAVETTGDSYSMGCNTDSNDACVYRDYGGNVGSSSTVCAYLLQDSGDSQECVLTSYNSDGASFTWTETGACTGSNNLQVLFTFYQ